MADEELREMGYRGLAGAVIADALNDKKFDSTAWLRSLDGRWWCDLAGLDVAVVIYQLKRKGKW